MEDTQVPSGDLTLTEGAPTTRADVTFVTEKVLADPAAGEPSGAGAPGAAEPGAAEPGDVLLAFGLVVVLGLVSLGVTVAAGLWLDTSAVLTLFCSAAVFTVVCVAGVFVSGLSSSRRS
ncbi:hypothetical protein [Spirillospora sp. NPDC047279]|uniref:hypothetical protein n=1 Tax=Spirillospora sp. NPDC047279 TaxID=3155478 RepID=UPI0033D67ACF